MFVLHDRSAVWVVSVKDLRATRKLTRASDEQLRANGPLVLRWSPATDVATNLKVNFASPDQPDQFYTVNSRIATYDAGTITTTLPGFGYYAFALLELPAPPIGVCLGPLGCRTTGFVSDSPPRLMLAVY